MSTDPATPELIPFVAESVEDAVRQVRNRLGPEAVVVNVRPLPARRSGLFRKATPRFEILAYRPESDGRLDATSDALAAPDPEPAPSIEPGFPAGALPASGSPVGLYSGSAGRHPAQGRGPEDLAPAARSGAGSWRVGALLEASGFLPANAQRVLEQLRLTHGDHPPDSLADELALARGVLAGLWRTAPPIPPVGSPGTRPQVFVGASGVGKSVSLCKWMTQKVLLEGCPVRVWRLDGATANTSESLSVYCEILGVPLERSWNLRADLPPDEMRFVDLPGTDWRKPDAVEALRHHLESLGPVHLHLVLNGAYDIFVMLNQVRAFSRLPVDDLIVTHLDEEPRWGKLWNLVLGTNFSIRFLSAGQNVPGDFVHANSDSIFARQFPT